MKNSAINILVADDDNAIKTVILRMLKKYDYNVDSCSEALKVMSMLQQKPYHLVLLDVHFNDGNGLEVLKQIKHAYADLPVIIISAETTFDTAIKASDEGAFEYLPKPFEMEDLYKVVNSALQTKTNVIDRHSLKQKKAHQLIGRSNAMQNMFKTIAKVAKTNLCVLICGESGTGKEVVARTIHENSSRKDNNFIAINMASLPSNLMESELFGYKKGAFTGADSNHMGKFALANEGTIFLDEIGDMPTHIQTALLRVLQEGEYTPLGSPKTEKTSARIIAATNRDLKKQVENGSFREDLFYRLNVVPINVPPLREHTEDIDELLHYFIAQEVENGLSGKSFSKGAIELMKQHTWSGNIRELQNLVKRILALHVEDVIDKKVIAQELEIQLSPHEVVSNQQLQNHTMESFVEQLLENWFGRHDANKDILISNVYQLVIDEVERPLLKQVMMHVNNNQSKAADILGINRNTLHKKLKYHDLL